MPIEPSLFPGEPEKIVNTALETLGLDYTFLFDLTGADPEWLRARLGSKELSVTEWIAICDALYLDLGSISYGYLRRTHKARIRWALRKGYFTLPHTAGFWKLRLELWRDLISEVQWQGRQYGFRLRWKARYQNALAYWKDRLSQNPLVYDPQERAQTEFRILNETLDRGL